MHVQFEFTEDDLVETAQRFLRRSKVVRSSRRKGLLWTAILTGALCFFIPPASGEVRAAFGIIGALLGAALHAMTYQSSQEKNLRKFYREQLGSGGPFVCEVELTPVGVWIKQDGTQITHEWEKVEEIKETEDSVDIFTRDGAGVVVRDRAFTSPGDKQRFLELGRGYVGLTDIGNSGPRSS